MHIDFVYFFKQPANRAIGETLRHQHIKKTTEPWTCKWRYQGWERTLHVPVDYVWDGYSIPRPAWSVIGITPSGLLDATSLPHDALYRAEGGAQSGKWAGCKLIGLDGLPARVGRKESDWLLKELMIYSGISKRKSILCYGVVRLAGARHWGGPCPTRKG